MSAALHPRTEIRLMQPADLKAVAAVERVAYQFPWSLGIFRDCLLAGYHCLLLDVGGSVTGYGIMSIAAGEAHLLNLSIAASWQRKGHGSELLREAIGGEVTVATYDRELRRGAMAAGLGARVVIMDLDLDRLPCREPGGRIGDQLDRDRAFPARGLRRGLRRDDRRLRGLLQRRHLLAQFRQLRARGVRPVRMSTSKTHSTSKVPMRCAIWTAPRIS